MTPFKIAVMAIFSVSIVGGLIIFALSKNTGSANQTANIMVWGTIPMDAFTSALQASTANASKTLKITYVRKDVSDFDSDFVEALAEGNGPDVVVLRDDLLYKNRNKLYLIPFKAYQEKTFKDLFIEEGELFLAPDGILAIPFIVDPMVMYWNRDIFSNNFISSPPKYWEELPDLVNKLTTRDNQANILQSAIAFGEWSNINNAKEIVAMLMLQAGTPITVRGVKGMESAINSQFGETRIPGQAAVDFYTKFSNPTSPSYTWNRSLPSSSNFFLSGNLGMYLGFASEISAIQQKNSNLNYNVAAVPQIKGTKKKSVFAHMYGLAIVKQTKSLQGSYNAINALTEVASLKAMEAVTNLPPVRRDMLSEKPTDDYKTVFYDSALISRSFIDPDPVGSSNSFKTMVESITSGRTRLTDAVTRASEEINAMLK